ncbi:MAG: cbb3-type cytochrome c oxidase subunit I [Deltaproteobacteria bacterium]|nr:cbb3-type cytochrome c oxidase subunit I [Deltaproteobacteria bacterium]
MSKITVWFIKCAMVYFLLAMLLGIHMAMGGPMYPFMQIHAHFNLLGWISMMIYGVGYHILPRFSGRPLYSERIAEWHFWLANIGLIGMALGWLARQYAANTIMLMIFSIIAAISAFLFVFNMFKTIKRAG